MTDLLLYVADADTEAFLGAILKRPEALSIREISFDIRRHPQKDSGMVQSGAELTRMYKKQYRKALLIFDHHGSGRDHRKAPEDTRNEIQNKLDSFTWKNDSAVIILMPELEEWLWHCENALLAHWGVVQDQLQTWFGERSQKLGKSVAELKAEQPKELFEYIMRDRLRKTISPRDFSEIGKRAGIHALLECPTFCLFAEILRQWFPKNTP